MRRRDAAAGSKRLYRRRGPEEVAECSYILIYITPRREQETWKDVRCAPGMQSASSRVVRK